jgi:hypothetical protein
MVELKSRPLPVKATIKAAATHTRIRLATERHGILAQTTFTQVPAIIIDDLTTFDYHHDLGLIVESSREFVAQPDVMPGWLASGAPSNSQELASPDRNSQHNKPMSYELWRKFHSRIPTKTKRAITAICRNMSPRTIVVSELQERL